MSQNKLHKMFVSLWHQELFLNIGIILAIFIHHGLFQCLKRN